MVDDTTNITWESVYKISLRLIEVLNILHPFIWSRVSNLMWFCNDPTKEQQMCIKFCTFLSRVITGDESWICGYDPETKQQSSQWKSLNSPRPKKGWLERWHQGDLRLEVMSSNGMLRHVALVRTDVSEECSASVIRMTIIGRLGTTLAVTSNRNTLRRYAL
jgi:hypothetical protein